MEPLPQCKLGRKQPRLRRNPSSWMCERNLLGDFLILNSGMAEMSQHRILFAMTIQNAEWKVR
jgi:hypothetical protein